MLRISRLGLGAVHNREARTKVKFEGRFIRLEAVYATTSGASLKLSQQGPANALAHPVRSNE